MQAEALNTAAYEALCARIKELEKPIEVQPDQLASELEHTRTQLRFALIREKGDWLEIQGLRQSLEQYKKENEQLKKDNPPNETEETLDLVEKELSYTRMSYHNYILESNRKRDHLELKLQSTLDKLNAAQLLLARYEN
mmetsp:Transcript_11836/g.31969  ORF Transcript_11836/g.31969 Transcript_11836/m.31969 type:complete len:139 (+) Transcript_11836:3110-3526(+)